MKDPTTDKSDKYSAREQGLGYLYQSRLALLRLLELPENTSVFLEKDDDLDFVDKDGRKSLASLKHKAAGDRLTGLSTDFWKSFASGWPGTSATAAAHRACVSSSSRLVRFLIALF